MTLSELIPAVLNSLVNSRVWQDATPDDLPRDGNNVPLPFILWSLMGGSDAEYADSSMPEFSHARVQIHSLAFNVLQTEQLAKDVRNALLASAYTVGVLGSPVGTYDNARKLRGRRQQFSIWFRQST